ncbi:PRKR-interacting protein 1 homolog [Anopheles maculipalpis]|uniref:PRKR-interacting protein 1 homolog n=1 Tax=Anopheles maculipalpis TaxID=1496333 RepID=UPI002159A779|nr:PRKR-interacting protein 1 homolog [Anopheles maculipalpis]
MEIRNEVKQKDQEVEKKKFVVRNAADVQRAKLEKLMKNPDKPVMIPAPSKNRDFSTAIPSFVRNVMGSSAGAGSGEFHVYRHLRRKEYARQKQIQEKSHAEQLDDAFQQKLENNRKAAEERTAKKRAKRLKKKAKQKEQRGKKPKLSESGNDMSEDTSEEEEEEDEEGNDGTPVQGTDAGDPPQQERESDKEQNESEKLDDITGKEKDSNRNDEPTQLANQPTENSAPPSEANAEDIQLETEIDPKDRPKDAENMENKILKN